MGETEYLQAIYNMVTTLSAGFNAFKDEIQRELRQSGERMVAVEKDIASLQKCIGEKNADIEEIESEVLPKPSEVRARNQMRMAKISIIAGVISVIFGIVMGIGNALGWFK